MGASSQHYHLDPGHPVPGSRDPLTTRRITMGYYLLFVSLILINMIVWLKSTTTDVNLYTACALVILQFVLMIVRKGE